jgi:hypothetical protein
MRNMNCRNVRREIEEVAAGELLSSSASEHLKNCAECGVFREERLKLREMLSSLGAVEAPGDFDFRLRARLANEKRGLGQPFVMRNLSFGFRSATVTAILLIGSALLFINLRTPPESSLSANAPKPPSTTTVPSPNNGQPASSLSPETVAHAPKTNSSGQVKVNPISVDVREKVATHRHGGSRRTEVASVLSNAPRGLKTRELSSTGATVLRPRDAMAVTGSTVFPIGASLQSLKVSLDNGRGNSRTISLPSVSFGSERVLAQSSSPFMASARSDW